jgi:peptidoglycan/xylan/chitin deacetylase (PgdA/CDA1 family)
VADPPPHIAARRARRRAQIRRRRIITLGCTLAFIAAAITAVAALSPAGRASSGPRSHHSGPSQPAPTTHTAAPIGSVSAASGTATVQRLIRLGLPIYCGGHIGNAVAITFDDGPGPYTHLALPKLAHAGERATFFVVGRSMDNFPGYLPRELKIAAIGDHTYTHPQLTALSPSMITWQLEHTAQKIEAQSGEHVELFRPPYGLHDAVVDRIARRLGLLEILWDVDSGDSLGANWAQIIKNVEAGLHPGAIILMHENHGQTIRALSTLLPELQRRHLRSVSVPELLAMDPPSIAQVRKGEAGCGVTGPIIDVS